jgi:hypothetical protein
MELHGSLFHSGSTILINRERESNTKIGVILQTE